MGMPDLLLTPEKLGLPLHEWQERMNALQDACTRALEAESPEREHLQTALLQHPDLPRLQDELNRAGLQPALSIENKVEVIRRAAAAQAFLALSSANYLSLRQQGMSDAEIDELSEKIAQGDMP